MRAAPWPKFVSTELETRLECSWRAVRLVTNQNETPIIHDRTPTGQVLGMTTVLLVLYHAVLYRRVEKVLSLLVERKRDYLSIHS